LTGLELNGKFNLNPILAGEGIQMTQETAIPYFPSFRVLIEFDSKFKMYVAHCLNTGNVVSADDSETTVQMMKEVLEDEVFHAIKYENFSNLFANTAQPDIWDRWNVLARKQKPREIPLNVKIEKVNLDDREPLATLELASAAN
jgi:hypothetical protein